MTFIGLVVGLLAVWRITHLLQAEDGPWEVVLRLRRAAGQGMLGRLLDCFYCLSLWVAAPVALLVGEGTVARLLLWPALSGGAILLERATTRIGAGVADYTEDESEASPRTWEEDDELLRPGAKRTALGHNQRDWREP